MARTDGARGGGLGCRFFAIVMVALVVPLTGPVDAGSAGEDASSGIPDSQTATRHAGPALPDPGQKGAGSAATSTAAPAPIPFVVNEGQWPETVLAQAETAGFVLWVTQSGLEFHLPVGTACTDAAETGETETDAPGAHEVMPDDRCMMETVEWEVIYLDFLGAVPPDVGQVVPGDRLQGVHHYYLGADADRWRTGVARYGSLQIDDVWPGVDLRMYTTAEGELEYDLGFDGDAPVQRAAFRTGPETTASLEDDSLVLESHGHRLVQAPPRTYAVAPTGVRSLPSAYVVDGDSVSFTVEGRMPGEAIVIDPIVYSTYFGPSSTEVISVDVGDDREPTLVGQTWSSAFPTKNAYQASYGGKGDMFVTRFAADGQSLQWSTYLGGQMGDRADSVDVAPGGEVVVGGTVGVKFPMVDPVDHVFGPCCSEAGVARMRDDGTVVFSTYLGGSFIEKYVDVAFAPDLDVVVTGMTSSDDFPVMNAHQPTRGSDAEYDWFVARIAAAGSVMRYSTYLGGDVHETYPRAAVNKFDITLVHGMTQGNFPVVAPRDDSYAADDAVAAFDEHGNVITASYLGGNGADWALDVAAGPDGTFYALGYTRSTDRGMSGAYQPTKDGWDDLVVSRLSSNGHSLLRASYLGGSKSDLNDYVYSSGTIDVDAGGRVYLGFASASSDLPAVHAFYPTDPDPAGFDGAVAIMSQDLSTLEMLTYWPGVARGMNAVAGEDPMTIYFVGGSRGAIPLKDPYRSASADGFLSKIAIEDMIASFTHPVPVYQNVPVTFTDTSWSPNGPVTGWSWSFGDGGTSTVQHPTHTYLGSGLHTVCLTAEDVIRMTDTACKTVDVLPTCPPVADFTVNPDPMWATDPLDIFIDASVDCEDDIVEWYWDTGQGHGFRAGSNHWMPDYRVPGTYNVCLRVVDSHGFTDTYCRPVDVRAPTESGRAIAFQWERCPVGSPCAADVYADTGWHTTTTPMSVRRCEDVPATDGPSAFSMSATYACAVFAADVGMATSAADLDKMDFYFSSGATLTIDGFYARAWSTIPGADSEVETGDISYNGVVLYPAQKWPPNSKLTFPDGTTMYLHEQTKSGSAIHVRGMVIESSAAVSTPSERRVYGELWAETACI